MAETKVPERIEEFEQPSTRPKDKPEVVLPALGGVYIPPHKLRRQLESIHDLDSKKKEH